MSVSIKDHPVFIREKKEHVTYCDGGIITRGNAWGQFREDECKYCLRMAKAKKHMEDYGPEYKPTF